jgi:hypothetical protein
MRSLLRFALYAAARRRRLSGQAGTPDAAGASAASAGATPAPAATTEGPDVAAPTPEGGAEPVTMSH